VWKGLQTPSSNQGKDKANKTHFDVGKKIRKTIQELGSAMPENLPVASDIKTVEKKVVKKIGGKKSVV